MNEKINIQEITNLLAEKHGITFQEAELFINEFFALIEEGLEQDRYVKVKGLGTFKLIEVDSRESVDVNTGERIEIQGHTKISFTPENALKEIVNRPFSHFEAVVLNDNVNFDDISAESEGPVDASENTYQATSQATSEVASATVKENAVSGSHEDEVREVPEKLVEKTEKEISIQQETTVNESIISGNTEPAENSGKGNMLLWIIVLTIFACSGITLSLYWNNLFPDKKGQLNTEREKDESMIQENISLNVQYDSIDSFASHQTDSLNCPETEPRTVQIPSSNDKEMTAQEKTPEKKTAQPAAKLFVPDSVGYLIIGTETSYTMREGETLTKVALKFFGTKALWPYIVKHNADVIKNPDNVPYGTVIRIPKLKKKQ